jgi:integrase
MRRKTGHVQKRGASSFRIRYYDIQGIRQEETIKGDREAAERELAKRLGEVASGIPVSSKPNRVLFEELADDVLNDYEINNRNSGSDIEGRFRLHILPIFGKRKAAQITTSQLKAYSLRRRNEGAPNGTINRELEAIRRAFNLAMHDRKILAMPHVPRLAEDNVRQGFFTREEVDRLCACLKHPLNGFVKFAFLTGWRFEEIRSLKWSNIDFGAGEIRLEPGTTKNKDGRTFPISQELRTLLTAKPPKPPQWKILRLKKKPVNISPYVFSINGKQIGVFRKTWRNACHAAGLPCVIDKETGKPLKAIRLFHDLRRSAVRELVRSYGLSEREAMLLTGHKTRSVFDRYSVVSQTDLRGIMGKLDANSKRANFGASGGGETS